MKGLLDYLHTEVYYMIVTVLFNFQIFKSQTKSTV